MRSPPAVVDGSVVMGIAQLVQQLSCRDQIAGAETLSEAVVDGLETGDGIGRAALVSQQASEACGDTQFPGQRALPARPVERLLEVILGRCRGSRCALQQQKLALDAH